MIEAIGLSNSYRDFAVREVSFYAASKSTPGIAVRMSTPTCSRPLRKNGPGSSKSAEVSPCSGGTELSQGHENRLSVFVIGLYQNVEVLGCARLRMDRYGVNANDEVFNAVCVQNGQEF
jgi:hypothetical protein